jgi:hypothetical protein
MFAAGMIASATGWFWGTFEHLLPLKCGHAMRMSTMGGGSCGSGINPQHGHKP